MNNGKHINFQSKVNNITLAVVVFGCLFPIMAGVLKYASKPEDITLIRFLLSDNLFLMILTAPVGLGLSVYVGAKYIHKLFSQVENERNNQIEIVERTTVFVNEIGKGNVSVEFKPFDNNDALGIALLQMRGDIVAKAQKDDERKWIMTGVAEVSEMLRKHHQLSTLGDELTAYLTRKVGAVQCAFYKINEENEKDVFIEMISCYAYNRKKYIHNKFKIGQGLVGQAVIEQDTLYRTEIPADYVSITSGLLGDKKPSAIIIVPLITNEKPFGVIELASLQNISPANRQFLNEVSEIIARTIFNLTVNENTLRMLNESRKMGQELEEQRQQLLENARKMVLSQEELEKSNQLLEEQMSEVSNAQKRLQVLLERSSEIISIYEPDGTIRFESPSIKHILGYNPEDLIGKNEKSKVHAEDVEIFDLNFARVLKNPEHSRTFQFRYLKKDGTEVWIESTLTNLLNDPAIKGVIMNSRDITTRMLAEKEQRMRGQMQALSENSPDLITRLGLDGNIYYVNPVIEIFKGFHPVDYIQNKYSETSIPVELKNTWDFALKEINETQQNFSTEVTLPTLNESRIFQIKGIPEFNEQNKLETALIVSQDITEQKNTENEIKDKNKKINDSINYAERIQRSILPQEQHITNLFNDSMVLFIPRDKVSGDFPWFYQKDDDIFISVVDCTGHGVPGALMSLIGHFVLNETIAYEEVRTPSVLLDYLHEGVKRTLKQEENIETRDGMDVAMCMINLNKGVVNFSGAHRHLYLVRNGEIIEYKGDKRPIGGVQYKNTGAFTNYEFNIEKGDAIYFYSDGLPDQIGGTEGKKLMNTRIKEIILKNNQLPMGDIRDVFQTEFNQWKENYKQIDDVLLIGIRF